MEQWRASGQTARVFASSQGINVGTLRFWSSKLSSRRERPAAKVDFVEIGTVGRRSQFEVVLGNGRRLFFEGGVNPSDLADVVRALEVT